MLVSFNWIKEFISIDDAPHRVADRLTMAGLEVESLVSVGSEWDNVVVGKILSIAKHPNADKLSVTTVLSGEHIYSVVCGAPNINEGQNVPLALEGAQLPNGTFIKKTKIRGQISEGMICSEAELGLGTDANGIMVLPPNAQHGMPLADYLNVRDTVFDISVTPNRPDCLSVLGIARELSALYDVPCVIPPTSSVANDNSVHRSIDIHIEAPDGCPRYAACVFQNITIQPSPLWMQRRLVSCGIRSINNIVDVTNYVMLERGQPLHAFDLAQISGSRIIVRYSRPGERFVTLDGIERVLPDHALLICDASRPVAIAGIMGGINSGVSAETKTILLESAYFSPTSINQTSRKLNLKTEASLRFEKGVDINGVIPSLNRAADLILSLSDGTVASDFTDCYIKHLPPSRPISISVSKTNLIAGTRLSAVEMSSLLTKLKCSVSSPDNDTIIVTPPSYRYDMTAPIDIVEEIARLSGYENIPSTLPVIEMNSPSPDPKQEIMEMVRDVLQAGGFFESVHYSFTSPEMIAALQFPDSDPRFRPLSLRNPLSHSQSVLRTTLLPNMLTTIRNNINNGALSLRMFEIGKVFVPVPDSRLPREITMLCGAVTGDRFPLSLYTSRDNHDIFDVKGIVDALLKRLHITVVRMLPPSQEPFMNPVNSLSLFIDDSYLGTLGQIHPSIAEFFEIEQPVYIFELDFDRLSSYARKQIRFVPFSRHPAIFRDIALIVEESVPSQTLLNAIALFNNKLITDVVLFDVFRGGSLPQGYKSIAFRIKFQSPERTLTDEEVNKINDRLISFLSKETGAQLRQ
ncbi:MAG: phenylalanine--tRNA ligase subunit beta [Desulfobacterota bacterium]|nr:phenylalanine--tRNA ligase subunit beta [Thermodesulfobacteriota bacterium]